jgi:hypothetical protein
MFKKTTRRSNGATKKVIVLIVLALFVALLMPTPGRAQVIEVPCQFSATLPLALAIDEANGSPGPDTIRLESGCTYGLFGTYVYDEGHNGLPTIYETLTIEGNGARLERMGNPNIRYRLLKASSDAALTIKDLTLANGYAYDPNNENVQGGAIHTTGDLTLNNVAIVNMLLAVLAEASLLPGIT